MARRTESLAASPARGRRRGPTKGDLKEAAILDTAWRLLGEKPLASITIDELAQGAGISRPTFYFYFDSRESVVRALGDRVADRLTAINARLFALTDDPAGGVASTLRAYLDHWIEDGPVLRAMVPLYEVDEDLRRFWADIYDQMADLVSATVDAERAAGRALPGPPSSLELVRSLFAMYWRVGYEVSLARPSSAELQRRAESLTTISLRAIYGTDKP